MNLMKRLAAALSALVMTVSLCAVGGISASAMQGAGLSSNMNYNVAFGCDLSYHNVGGDTLDYSLVDFAKMKADGCQFAILRIGYEPSASNGSKRVLDKAFVEFYNRARAAGMALGVYFYSGSLNYADAAEDAQWCMSIIEQYNMYFEYPIYYDIEEKEQNNLGSSAMNSLCLGWCETLEKAGYFPGIYAGQSQCLEKLTGTFKETYDTWVPNVKTDYDGGAQWNPNTMHKRDVANMWQYAWYEYEYNGIGLNMLDVNVAYKDYPTIMQTYGYNNVVTRHKITFETNGGTAVEPVYVKDGTQLSEPTAPSRYAMDFGGWYCNPELTDPYDFSSPVPYGFTLYAKWNEQFWGGNNNLMPNEQQMQLNDFNGQGAIWPYWNNDEYGSVTLYNGVTNDENWSWPSAYMTYENSFDSANDAYLYVKKDGTAQFNVIITYLDKNGEAHDLYISDIGNNGNDLPAGVLEEFYDVGSYIRNLGHAPESGNVKFTKVTYYVVGEKDSYVKLYDLKLTPKFTISDPYITLMDSDIQQLSGAGNYVYNNGTLTVNGTSDNGYSIKMNIGKDINPTDFRKLLVDVTSTAPFNIAVELTNGNGDARMNVASEFYDTFGFETAPEALPAGTWAPVMNLAGYYEWNGGAVTSSTIKSVTITVVGKGTLTMKAFQASRKDTVQYVQDGKSANGSLSENAEDILLGDTDGNGVITTADARVVLQYTIGSYDLTALQLKAADYDGNGTITTADARDILISTL